MAKYQPGVVATETKALSKGEFEVVMRCFSTEIQIGDGVS